MNEAEIVIERFMEVYKKLEPDYAYGTKNLITKILNILIEERTITPTSVLLGKIIVFGDTWDDILEEVKFARNRNETEET